jgi:glycosyltransferase involved in cell wall biosynthesis
VSVVIPAYNAEAVLARALESVFQQTCPVQEVIVVNDGSRDRTAEVMASYDARIIGMHTENQGAAAARNAGIQRATSHWIAFLDADDAWHVDKMERQWATLEKNPHAILCYAPMQNVNSQGGRELIWPEVVCESEHDDRCWLHWGCLAELPPTPTVLVLRSALERTGLFPVGLPIAEDLDLWVRLLTVGKFVGVPAVLADRHLSSTSLTATHSQVAQYQRYFQVLRSRRSEIRQWLGNRRVNGVAYLHSCVANVYARAAQRWPQAYHAFLGTLGPHPQQSLAMKLLCEAILGTTCYSTLVGWMKRARTPAPAVHDIS